MKGIGSLATLVLFQVQTVAEIRAVIPPSRAKTVSACTPGISTGDYQLRQTMRNLLDGLEEADLDFGRVVATNVYLDDMREIRSLDETYARYLKEPFPARTTVQQVEPAERQPDEAGRYPTLEQISVIAVK